MYIGITSQIPEKRWLSGHGYANTYFGNAIKKYGWKNIKHEILYTGLNEDEAKKKEKELICKYNSNNRKHGYNLTSGGDGKAGIKPTKEQIKLLKDLLSKPVYQRDLSGNFIKKWESIREIERSLGFARSNITQCCKDKTYQAYGYLWSFDEDCIKEKEKRKNCKPVYQYDLKGNFVKEWKSLIEIQNTLGYLKTNISHCCLGTSPSAYEYVWSYQKKYNITYKNKNLKKQREIYQLSKDMVLIAKWDNLKSIESALGYNKSAISACCRCKNKTAYGYIWRYKENLDKKIPLVSEQAKRVLQLDKKYNFVAEFESVCEAQRKTGINNISNCCNRKRKTAGGYVWIYKEDNDKFNRNKI